MDTNVVERVIRPITITRKNALFAGNDGGARHWAIAMTLIQTALCRVRHSAVYAVRRTMPNGLVFPRYRRGLDVIGSA
jgi:transposase